MFLINHYLLMKENYLIYWMKIKLKLMAQEKKDAQKRLLEQEKSALEAKEMSLKKNKNLKKKEN